VHGSAQSGLHHALGIQQALLKRLQTLAIDLLGEQG
jgi:hypothetical protein